MKLLLAISGGVDSVTLLDALANERLEELAKNSKFIRQSGQNSKLVFAYFNHGTPHGKKAEIFVKKLAKKYRLPLHIGCTKKKLHSEAEFREARYKFLRQLRQKLDAERIVTAHTADDQAETLLLNLARGTGLSGLSAMQEDTGEILRPLLGTAKKTILNYAKKRQLSWIEDPSNTDPKYTRNFLRHKVLPQLTKLNPQIITALTRTATQARASQDFLQTEAKNWLKSNAQKTTLPLKEFNELPEILRSTIIRTIYSKMIGDLKGLEEVHILEILALAQNPAGNKQKKCGKLIFRTGKKTGERVLIWH